MGNVGRRGVLAGLPLSALAGATRAAPTERLMPAQTRFGPPRAQAPETRGPVDIGGGVKLFTRDTGGRGEAVILLHAATGSAQAWDYQQPAFAKAGYRVVAYSRRGHTGSEVGPGPTGSGAEDLAALADALKIGRFHLVGTAAGGFVAIDFALWKPERLLSLTLASSRAGVTGPDAAATRLRMQPDPFDALPAAIREVGPSYRAAYPEGVRAWEALEHAATPKGRVQQRMVNRIDAASLKTLKVPTLVFTGDADLLMPPSSMRAFAAMLPACERAVIAEAGHSASWEQPEAFNALVLDFLRRHRARA